MRNWAQLSPDLLQSIAKRIHSYEDFLAFAGVCSSWSSAAKFVQIPWLMLAEEEGGSDIRGFSSLRNATIVHRVNLPEARGRHCIGSMGWLITVDDRGFLELLHPLTRFQIPLPRPASYEYYEEGDGQNLNSNRLMIRRAALSASPSVTKDYTLMVIFGSHCDVAFWKSGTKTWTLVEPRPEPCLDVIYYKNRFFGLVLINAFDGAAAEIGDGNGSAYFVESPCGDLLVVSRQRDFDDDCVFYTCSFKIYKFDSLDVNKCEKINDLEGAAIFVGHSGATAVSAAASGIKPNCIYFTDDNTDAYSDMENPDNVIGGRDMGIFNLENQSIEPLMNVVGQLFFWKPGNKVWKNVSLCDFFWDVIYYKDQFYTNDYFLGLCSCDTNSGSPHVRHPSAHMVASNARPAHLVESAGELLVVLRERGREISFRVYKYDSADMIDKWQEIKNFGGESKFCGL